MSTSGTTSKKRTQGACCVPGCSDWHSSRHLFPNPKFYKNHEAFNIWLLRINNPKLFSIPKRHVYKTYRVCERHFEKDCFMQLPGFRNIFKKGSLPTLFLPNYPEKEDLSEFFTYLEDGRLVPNSELPYSIDVPAVPPDAADHQQVDNADTLLNLDLLDLQIDGEKIFPSSLYVTNKQQVKQEQDSESCNSECREITDDSDTQHENQEQDLEDTFNQNAINEMEPDASEKPFFKSVKSYLVESRCMKEVCRICFKTILDEEMTKLYVDSQDANDIRNMLMLVLPDLDLEVYPNAVVCIKCKELVEYSFQLKELWLSTEEKLQRIIENKKGDIKPHTDLVIVTKTASTTVNRRMIKDILKCNAKAVTQTTEEDTVQSVEDTCNNATQTKIQGVEDTCNKVSLNTGGSILEKILKEPVRRKCKQPRSMGPYICEKCGSILTTLASLRGHLRRHNRKFKPKPKKEPNKMCEFCGKIFLNAGALGWHKIVHTAGPWKCSLCHQIFTYKKTLEVHVRRKHLKLSDYQCHICGKQFVYSTDLRLHIRRHDPKLHDRCHICNKTFTTRSFLKRHLQKHAENSHKFKCEYCGNAIKHKESLIKHIQIFHQRIGGFTCDFCDKIYWKKTDLMHHRIRVHGWGPDVTSNDT